MKLTTLRVLALICVTTSLPPAHAGDGTWQITQNGKWHEATNWTPAVPQLAGDVATFADSPANDTAIDLDLPTTIGGLIYNRRSNTEFGGAGPLIFDNGDAAATIENQRRSGFINVTAPVVLRSHLDVINESPTRIDLRGGVTSADGFATDLQLRSRRNQGFQLLGGVDINGDLTISGGGKSFFAGDLSFSNLILDQAEATFESPFTTGRLTSGPGSQLTLEQPATVAELLLGGGTINGIEKLTVTEASVVTEGLLDFENNGNLFGTKLIKEGAGRFSALNVGNDLQHDIIVREGSFSLEYPDPGVIQPVTGTGTIRLEHPNSQLILFADMFGTPLNYALDLGNVRPPERHQAAISGNAHLAGPVHLGDIGASTSGGFQISGPLSGGSLFSNGELFLVSANHTFTGDLAIQFGSVKLTEDAQLTTPRSVQIEFGDLQLDGRGGTQRLSEDIPISMKRGSLGVNEGALNGGTTQRVGDVEVTERSNIYSSANDLQLKSLDVAPDATLRVNAGFASGRVLVKDAVATDLLPTNIRVFNQQFAAYDPVQGIVPAELNSQQDPSDWDAMADAQVVRRTTLSEDAIVRTLTIRLSDEATTTGRLTIAPDTTLNVLTGGTRLHDFARITGAQGRLTAGGDQSGLLYFVSDDGGTIGAAITDNSGPDGNFTTTEDNGSVGLVVDSNIELSGTNSYSGPTTVLGSLIYTKQAAISPDSDIVLRGGAVQAQFPGVAQFGSIVSDEGTLNGIDTQIQADLFTINSGGSNISVTDNTPIIKQSNKEGHVAIDANYRDTIDLREGKLRLNFFEPSNAIFGEHQATVRMRAGTELDMESFAMNGIIEGNGTINFLTFNRSGSILRPGLDDSIGQLKIGTLHVQTAGTYEWQLADALGEPGTGYDHLKLENIATVEASQPWTIQIGTLTDGDGNAVQPANFDRRRTYSWELASIERPDEFSLDFSKLAVDASSLDDLLPNAFSFALIENSWRLEYGQVADINGDSILNAEDLDAACSQGRDIERIANEYFGVALGDINLDGAVGFDDFLTFSGNFGKEGGWATGDTTCDGHVTFADFLILSKNFGATDQNAQAQSVPEPHQLFWLYFAVCVWLRQRP